MCERTPVYGLWIYDPVKDTQRPIDLPQEGYRFDEAVLMTSRPLPNYIRDFTPEGESAILAEAGYGLVNIRSVMIVMGLTVPRLASLPWRIPDDASE